MILSTSTLNAFLDCPRSYLNKQMMLPKITFDYFTYGKEGHEVIQKHISGRPSLLHPELKEKLAGINFPIVEEKNFDERLKFTLHFGEHDFIGFLDARNDELKIYADIKISTTLWTLKKFMDLMQRKVYQLAYPDYSFIGITATPDLSEITTVNVHNRPQDAEKAREWIVAGIKAVNESKFEANPTANCHRCVYRDSCKMSRCVGGE